jgi:hypothetical protein
MRIAYADPPYPGKAARFYKGREGYAGEVDHYRLVLSLATSYDGWALSTGAYALRELLPFCPPEAQMAPWVKPNGVSGQTFGPHNAWEPVIYCPARRLRGGVRDWLRAKPARGGGDLPGRKPLAFCAWLFDLLGMLPGDELVDLFPGTGIVSRAWRELSLRTSATDGRIRYASLVDEGDTSLLQDDDASLLEDENACDPSRAAGVDASLTAGVDVSPEPRGVAGGRCAVFQSSSLHVAPSSAETVSVRRGRWESRGGRSLP